MGEVSSYHGNEKSSEKSDAKTAEETDNKEAPGIRGLYKLLHDDELWHAIQPLLAGLRAFRAARQAYRQASHRLYRQGDRGTINHEHAGK
ncbi:hypothetical protein HSBAA_PA_1420 (plasmid) [Vreelandella sulfidaeris]|uniref:Uncharacterized protein n=1 Tax=Vreelandella sulfidaeris TaxID=115553 RepID=A0A455UMP2_9GAMM|nr:hypothetical protein HSBAA_PA_1420 [Halomonas sulfidaeris]